MTPFFLSAFLAPGAGQIYRRQFVKGFVMLGLCLFGLGWMLVEVYYVVIASLQIEPLLVTDNLVERAVEIRHGINLLRFVPPLALVAVSYVWGIIDILWAMSKEKQACQQREGRPGSPIKDPDK